MNVNRIIGRYINFQVNPVRSGFLYGIFLSIILILVLLFLWLFFVMLEMFGVDTRSIAAGAGFVVLPFIVLLGFPWSFWIVTSFDMYLLGMVSGLVFNGAIIGSIVGYLIKIKNQKSNRS
ncbi:MAG: hypothetical protein U9N57_09755 [Pseudomonadota bacterium]|nr:hypothetical protein [Pseudomonadota bacterium]